MDNRLQLIIEALDKTHAAFNGLKGNLNGVSAQVAGVTAAFRGLLASAPFLALAGLIRNTASAGEEFLKVSKQMGISVENISTLKYAAEQSAASFEDLTSGLKFFSKALYGVNDAGQPTTFLLKQLGVTAKDPYQALLQVADAFSKMEDGFGKGAIAMHLFGRGGLAMISMLNEGAAGIKKLQGEVKEFSTAAAKAGDEFNDNLTKLKRNIMDIVYIVGNELIPAFNNFFDAISGRKKPEIELKEIEQDIKILQKFIGKNPLILRLFAPGLIEKAKKELSELQYKHFWMLAPREIREGKETKLSPAPLIPSDLAAGEARATIDAELKIEQDGLKMLETQRLEAQKTEEKNLELKYTQGLLSEKEYQKQKAAIQAEGLKWAIIYAEAEKKIIQEAFLAKEWLKKEGKAKTDAESKANEEQAKIDREIEKDKGELDRLGIQTTITGIEYTKKLSEAEREGNIKVLEARITLQKELNALQLERGDITPLAAKEEELHLEKELLKAKLDNITLKIEGPGISDADRAALKKEAVVLQVQFNTAERDSLLTKQAIIATQQKEKDHLINQKDQQRTLAELTGDYQKQRDIEQELIKLRLERALLDTNLTEGERSAMKALAEEQTRALEAMTSPGTAYLQGLKDTIRGWTDTARQMYDIAKATASAMESAFSDFFFDAFQGKLKSLADYLKSFLTSVQRALAQALGQQVTGSIISGISSLFGSPTPMVSGTGAYSVPAGTLLRPHEGGMIMHEGGYIPRFHFGGLNYDERPAILQTGEGVLSRQGMAALGALNAGGGGGTTIVNIQMENKTGLPLTLKQTGQKTDEKQKTKTIMLDLVYTDIDFINSFKGAMAR